MDLKRTQNIGEILHFLFESGAWNNHVKAETYQPELEKFFANQNISDLDTWVFNKVETFLQTETQNEALKKSDQIILFLHLLGLDTNGHSNKPHSVEFAKNLQIVDQGVEKMVRLCEEFWKFDQRDYS